MSSGSNRAVLVTGASTGIGYACALELANAGYAVYASVRNDADAQRLRTAHAAIAPLRFDVTDAAAVRASADLVRNAGRSLHAVVSNAGIAVAGPLEFLPLDDLRRQFEINVFGAVAVTQAFLPLLRASRGRVVFMGSASGRIAPPFVGAYAASKHALEAIADAMRLELRPFGIDVSIVDPGNVRTPIWQKGRDARADLEARMGSEATKHYGGAIERLARVSEREERTGVDPELIARTVLDAVRSPRPRARYAVGNPPGWLRALIGVLPERLRDRLVESAMTV